MLAARVTACGLLLSWCLAFSRCAQGSAVVSSRVCDTLGACFGCRDAAAVTAMTYGNRLQGDDEAQQACFEILQRL